MALRVLIACGGTGGHLFPGVAVAEELRRRGHEPLLLVSRKEIDKTALAGRDHLPSRALPAVGWPGLSFRLFRFASQLWSARKACRALFDEVRPDAVLGMGGFTSAVPAWEAKRRRVPSLIHESNAVPGRVTRLMAKWADRTLLGFAACAPHLAPARCEVTGTPVRAELVRLSKEEAASALGLDPARKTLLVIGGSQGAQGINRLLAAAAPMLAGDGIQFIHQTGKDDEATVVAAYAQAGARAVVKAFLNGAEMAAAYSLADLAVARSGASSLTELGHYGLPSVLIPFPAAADDHQTANARVFEAAGAARLRPQAALNAEELAATVRNLLSEAGPGCGELETMRRAAAGLSVPDAAARVANEVESCAKK